jgi:hypothetical protein
MSKIRIFSFIFAFVALGLAYYLYDSIKRPIEEQRNIARVEAKVIEKLKIIREAQLAYFSVHGEYASNFDKLINFIHNGEIPNVQRKEIILQDNRGQDSVIVQLDTLGIVSVKDSLFNQTKYPNLDINSLSKVPGSETGAEFEIFAGKLARARGVSVDVFEVKDPDPINPDRRARRMGKQPLKVGSRTDVTVAGNWE